MLSLNAQSLRQTLFLLGAIVLGSVFGAVAPDSALLLGGLTDYLILALVVCIFLSVPFENVVKALRNVRFLSVAWLSNFVLLPLLGWGLASLFLHGKPLFAAGLIIYFMAPCTDWFLAFTKLAKGDTALGAALLPINMLSQLLLYPVYMFLFVGNGTGLDLAGLVQTLVNWFAIPFAAAMVVRMILLKTTKRAVDVLDSISAVLVELILVVLVFAMFANHIGVILEHIGTFVFILAAVFTFFVLVYNLTGFISRKLRFPYPVHVLYTMTTSARNAPLMLGITMVAFPNQPIIYAALIIGMLVEFPHLAIITRLLTKSAPKHAEV